MDGREEALAKFEERGVDWVRDQYETGRLSGFEERFARHWLGEHDRKEVRSLARDNRRRDTATLAIAAITLIVTIITLVVTVDHQ